MSEDDGIRIKCSACGISTEKYNAAHIKRDCEGIIYHDAFDDALDVWNYREVFMHE